jgi:hypothetical protein
MHKCVSSAFERTLPQLHEMVELAGLKVKKVNATRSVTVCVNLTDAVTNIYQGVGFDY